MDDTRKLCCPNCSQFYFLKTLTPRPKGNLPLFLSCGHSMCESCIGQLVKFGEPIQCKVCNRDIELSSTDVLKYALIKEDMALYDSFPVNIYMLGEIVMSMIEKNDNEKQPVENYVDLKSIVKSTQKAQGKCFECHKPTSKMCLQCSTTICESCFNKTHRNFVVFKIHVLQDIDNISVPSMCKIHTNKEVCYYCKDCSKAICMDCMMVGGSKSCKNHNVESLQSMNETFIEELTELAPQVDETFRRLTKTAVDIGNLLQKMENNSGSTSEISQTINNIGHHFAKLMCSVQKHKQEVTNNLRNLRNSEKKSLLKAKVDVEDALKKSLHIFNQINTVLDPNKNKQNNLYDILEEAKNIVKSPWYLSHDQTNEKPLKVAVEEDLCMLITDYVHLEGNAPSSYKLKSSSDIEGEEIPPAPPTPVYPPELPKDVRLQNQPNVITKQNTTRKQPELMKPSHFIKEVPKFFSKAESISSLDSIGSATSSYRSSNKYESYQKVQQVMPFEVHPKELAEGTQERIYISHIVDPHNFYVQRACYQDTVKELMREFRNVSNLPKPAVSHVKQGKIYLGLNKVDQMWMRCRIMFIDTRNEEKPMFNVFFIDFGSTDVLSVDKLRVLPPARVHSPSPLAIHCSLANCVPINGQWTNNDAILIQTIIDNKQAAIFVRRVRCNPDYTVTLECDVTTYEDAVSLAHALVFHDRATIVNSKIQYFQILGPAEKPKIFMSNNDFKYKTTEEVQIVHIVSPDKFFIRKSHLQTVYEKLCDDLEQEYTVTVNTGSVYLPEVGSVYVACIEELNCMWHRGVVTELPGRGRVRLFLPDIGLNILVHWTKLRKISTKFTTLRALANECHLSGVTPLNKKWSVASVTFLQTFQDKVLELHVEDTKNKQSIGVTLYDKSDLDDIKCINTMMIKYKFAVSFGLYNFNQNTAVEEQPITNKAPPTEPKTKQKPQKKPIKILSRNEPIKSLLNKSSASEDDLDAKDKGPLRLEAKILHCQSPSLLYVSFVSLQKACKELYDKIQKHYTKNPGEPKTDWNIGDRCCTICTQSNTWRRSVIIELIDTNAKVFYADFACSEVVPIDKLRELKPDFTTIGDAAVKCHLSGIIPAVGEEWPSLTKEYLKELIEAYNRVFVTKSGNFKDQSMPVELWVYHTVQGGALEPDKSEWRCLNKKIIDQGLAIPDKATEPQSSETPPANEDEILSFLNIQGTIQDWLQLEPIPLKPLSPRPDIEPSTSTPECEENLDPSTLFISEWIPAEKFLAEEFTAVPTYIDHHGVIYLHDVNQDETLTIIRRALDNRFVGPDPKSKYVKWTVGQPCIAKFCLDNKFYRATVVEVNEETAKCMVHYVDYGNEECCDIVDMRNNITMYQVPIQAHKCVLNKIRPVGGRWSSTTLDYIHKFIVEKKCFVRVAGPTVDGITPIDLKFDKIWINDHLVEFDMAEYTDGTKPVIAKFAPKQQYVEATVEENDSGPEYIVEDDSDDADTSSISIESIDMKRFEEKKWSDILDEDNEPQAKVLTYPERTEQEFLCHVSLIKDVKTMELNIVQSPEEQGLYENMYAGLQKAAASLPPLNGMFENKACVAIFKEDGLWYRAKLLQYSEVNRLVKVKFVDYGNEDVVPLANAKEITEDWVELPPANLTAQLHGVELNKDIETEILTQKYTDTFLEKETPFHAKVIDSSGKIPQVELRNENGELIYKSLIEEEIFLMNEHA